jgi:hypothetical protein
VSKPILCLDFDGVLHSYTSGWQGAGVANDPPVPGAADFLHRATARFTVAIYSSRSKSLAGRACMKRYVRQHLDTPLTFSPDHSWDFVSEELKWPWFKPSAFITIDDRALTFDGSWPELDALAAFKPWNKRNGPPG